MRDFSIEEGLERTIRKLQKKDKPTYDILMKKMKEILNTPDINHYKNLRHPLQEFKRVHIHSSFVLIFKYIQSEDKIIFYDLDHHDRIYSN